MTAPTYPGHDLYNLIGQYLDLAHPSRKATTIKLLRPCIDIFSAEYELHAVRVALRSKNEGHLKAIHSGKLDIGKGRLGVLASKGGLQQRQLCLVGGQDCY